MTNDRKKRAERAEQMRKEREKADKRQRNLITIGIVVVVVALVAVGGFAIQQAAQDNAKNDDLVAPKNTTKDYGIVYGPADAGGEAPAGGEPVSVEMYEDFQCPACLAFEQQSSAFLSAAVKSGDIEITYRPFSFLDEAGGSPNDYSKRSTNVAMCALDKGGVQDYVKVHEYLYANQPEEGTPGPENGELLDAVQPLAITGIESCVRTERFVPWIEKAKEAGQDAGVSGTPTIKVDGKVLENPNPQTLQVAITAAQGA